MKMTRRLVVVASAAFLCGCAATGPGGLSSARPTYLSASGGQAAPLAPAELHTAQGAPSQAGVSHAEDPESRPTRGLSVVARGGVEMADRAVSDAVEAERRASDAIAALANVATVSQDRRGTVIGIPGSVLFRFDETSLTSGAQRLLDQIAAALLMNPSRNILVEGFTDSQGAEDYNIELSQHQANAVRNYLVRRGYSGGRVRARGNGEDRPAADNATDGGRAENRRIEIVREREVKL
jgi:outer membrane protein OmpA-like peptidoglycan-associated protein